MVFLLPLSLLFLMFPKLNTQQCGIDSYSIYQRMLKGHTFKTFKARPLSLDCKEACVSDYRCQSYNYDWSRSVCELNNRTKEAKPDHFVRSENRYYVREPNKVSIGSIPELPADSCAEIKADEGDSAHNGSYWLDPTRSGNATLVLCDMTNGIADFCNYHRCSINHATCVNHDLNYTCSCETGWTGSYCEQDVDECTETPNVCPVQSTCHNSLGSYHCICKSGWKNTGPDSCVELNLCLEGVSHSCPPNSYCINITEKNTHECECSYCYHMSNDSSTCLPDCRSETKSYYATEFTKKLIYYYVQCGWWGLWRCIRSKYTKVSKRVERSREVWIPNRDGASCPCL